MIPNGDENQTQGCGLYAHFPFCDSKCGYCDFFSIAVKTCPTMPFVRSLVKELRSRLPVPGHQVKTIFFGGGTPTVLTTEELQIVMNALGTVVDVSAVEEFTVEANPATVDDAKAELLSRSGVTRVSMGAQSFLPSELAVLERLHSPDDIAPSVQTLRRHGIGQLNIDLIFGIPGQTVETWSESLEKAIALEPDHIACYGLTYEPGTKLTAQKRIGLVKPTPESLEATLHELTIDRLAQAGLEQYEISNFSRAGCECRHNLNYWRNGPCVSIGPSATGNLYRRRYKNIAHVSTYVEMIQESGNAEADVERIDRSMLLVEMIMMQMRLKEGVCLQDVHARTGIDLIEHLKTVLGRLTEMNLIQVSSGRIALTRSGQLVGDAVIAELVNAVDVDDASAVESAAVSSEGCF